MEGTKSQCGYVKSGDDPATSSSIKRVCRSILAAESNALLMAEESADYIRSLLREIMNPGISLRDPELNYPKKPAIAFTEEPRSNYNHAGWTPKRHTNQAAGGPDQAVPWRWM